MFGHICLGGVGLDVIKIRLKNSFTKFWLFCKIVCNKHSRVIKISRGGGWGWGLQVPSPNIRRWINTIIPRRVYCFVQQVEYRINLRVESFEVRRIRQFEHWFYLYSKRNKNRNIFIWLKSILIVNSPQIWETNSEFRFVKTDVCK